MTKIKICGIYRPEDIAWVNQAMPDYCGFVINFPKSHRNVTREQVQVLSAGLKKEIVRVGVIVNQSIRVAADLLNSHTVDIVQLHGDEDDAYIQTLREQIGEPDGNAQAGKIEKRECIWQAFKIVETADLERAMASTADRILLDQGYGTGKTFDWSLTGQVAMTRPYILAGGLTPENIPAAIAAMQPWGIDISSGVETDKIKDGLKIMAAVSACRG